MITGFHGHRHSRGHPLLGRGLGKVPLPVANDRLATWLHADTAATGEGTVTADGSGNVSEWRDPRGGFAVTLTSGVVRTGELTLNGKNVLRGNANPPTMQGAVSIDPTQKIRVFVVGQMSRNQDAVFDLLGTSSSRLTVVNRTTLRATNENALDSNQTAYSLGVPILIEALHDNDLVASNQEFDKFEDGVQLANFPRSVTSDAFTTQTMNQMFVFNDSNGGNDLNGNAFIAEHRLYVGDLTAQEITDIRAEMTGEWLFT